MKECVAREAKVAEDAGGADGTDAAREAKDAASADVAAAESVCRKAEEAAEAGVNAAGEAARAAGAAAAASAFLATCVKDAEVTVSEDRAAREAGGIPPVSPFAECPRVRGERRGGLRTAALARAAAGRPDPQSRRLERTTNTTASNRRT